MRDYVVFLFSPPRPRHSGKKCMAHIVDVILHISTVETLDLKWWMHNNTLLIMKVSILGMDFLNLCNAS